MLFRSPYLSAALGCIGLNAIHYLPLQATAFIDEARAAAMRQALVAMIDPRMDVASGRAITASGAAQQALSQ